MSSSNLPVPPAKAPTTPLPVPPVPLTRTRLRIVLVASSDASLRQRLRQALTGLRWQVLEAQGGAEAWTVSQSARQLEAMLIDPWLPDLNLPEFLTDFHREYPGVAMMLTDGAGVKDGPRSSYHQELLYALRCSQETDTAAWNASPNSSAIGEVGAAPSRSPLPLSTHGNPLADPEQSEATDRTESSQPGNAGQFLGDEIPLLAAEAPKRGSSLPILGPATIVSGADPKPGRPGLERVSELVGMSPVMLEVSRRIRLVAGRLTPVLIEGPTGSGKELVAAALHRLSNRARKPFVAINCAAIPEALLEAELFGHTRGAFTGAVQGRVGRIESADGGTLFLDEIGEMPLPLQSKLLRFLESGELQRIGDNETVKVDVRIVAATHQPLAEHAGQGTFRSDLYFRLAVFLIHTPALSSHLEDLTSLVDHFLERMGRTAPVKRLDASAMTALRMHAWPGNVRELEHVLERASILAGEEPVITAAEIDFGLAPVH